MDDLDACQTCHYWRPSNDDGTKGSCRMSPPILVPFSGSDDVATMWPRTLSTDWCGEYAVTVTPDADTPTPQPVSGSGSASGRAE